MFTHEGEFQRDGYLVTNANDLLGAALWAELQEAVATLRATPLKETSPINPAAQAKKYLHRWLGPLPLYQAGTIWARVAEVPPLVELATAYLGEPDLRYYNIWQTDVSTKPPSGSQLWHRDVEDRRMLKAFIYLSDVDRGAGPLWVIPGSHRMGARAALQPKFTLQAGSARTSDAQMADCVPESEWRELTGPTGTVILMDTAGWHKGGYATERERWLYTCQYTTPKAVPRAGPPFKQP